LDLFDVAAILIVAAAALGYLNHRVLRLPHTIGLTVTGAIASLGLVAVEALFPGLGLGGAVRGLLTKLEFQDVLMEGMLSFLLFAGALHVDIDLLLKRKWTVAAMATVGVLISTVVVAGGVWLLASALGLTLPFLWCLVFGALISPTDPVAVLGILKSVRVPPSLEAKIAGESLFNDGVGIVLFAILLGAAMGESVSVFDGALFFAQEAGGGALLGLAVGGIGYFAMKRIDEHNIEILITLAMVMGGYALAQRLHVSGPIAMATAGLLIGNRGIADAMSETTARHLTSFWSLVDEILNSVLFLVIGLEAVAVSGATGGLLLGAGAILIVLLGRVAGVGGPMFAISRLSPFTPGAFPLMVWGGLRGGISIALALSLPAGPAQEILLTVTYVVVVFSVAVQGLTVGKLARRVIVRPEDLERD
ncbi:MAG: sodium:proton antiporter, partial [Rhodospirillaceae bacterium]|nr:sodium:proton antiporter [Rhodospirillaceae bacterium]